MTIRSEIESRLAAYAAAQTPKIPVAYENVGFTKPTTGCYLEIFMLNSTATSRDVGASGVRYKGMFQINCYAPLGAGMSTVDALADAVIQVYPVLPKVGTVSVEAPLNASAGIPVDGFMCVPVTGRFRVEI
jgi:hypothetical protein